MHVILTVGETSKTGLTMTSTTRRDFLVGSTALPFTPIFFPPTSGQESVELVDVSALGSYFTTASEEYGVPVAVLLACARVQSQDDVAAASSPLTGGGQGPMKLVDGTIAKEKRSVAGKPDAAVIDSMGEAAAITGQSKDQIRTDVKANISGAAAVLAATQKKLGGPVGSETPENSWYAAIAMSSGAALPTVQRQFSDDVMKALMQGGQVDIGGAQVPVPRKEIGDVSGQKNLLTSRETAAQAIEAGGMVEAPPGLSSEWVPAPYVQYGATPSEYGNHDVANRPVSPELNQIVMHSTEASFAETLNLVQDPTYLGWHYSFRSSDGFFAQHIRTKDLGWHAGNWYVNSHSIGIEHEGYAAQGAQWFTEAMYSTSAKLVSYLAKKYQIPLDRAHIIEHGQVPAINRAGIPAMHWDPGPYWDWERYFALLGAPLDRGTVLRLPSAGEVVRILPGFANNFQDVSGCGSDPGAACPVQGTNFVPIRVSPDAGAALVNDLGLHQTGQPASTEISDISSRASAGTDYVVAEVKGDWTAIWYLGVQGWFKNPAKSPTARVVLAGKAITPKPELATVKTYGTAYPEASAYPDPATAKPISPLGYEIPSGQRYPLLDALVPTDAYLTNGYDASGTGKLNTDVHGRTKYYLINIGHRLAYVQSSDVAIV